MISHGMPPDESDPLSYLPARTKNWCEPHQRFEWDCECGATDIEEDHVCEEEKGI